MSKKLKTCIVALSLAVYVASLTQTAFTANDFDGERAYSSISVSLMGAMAVLGGGFFEWVIWFANPLYVLGLVLFFRGDTGAGMKCSIAAAVLALSFMTRKEVLAAENGRTAEIVCLNAGYWLWLAGLTVLAAGTVYGFAKHAKAKKGTAADGIVTT